MVDAAVKAIQDKIEALGISQREAARRAGIPPSTLRNILSGNTDNSRTDTMAKIVAGLELETEPDVLSSGGLTMHSEVRAADLSPSLLRNLPKDVPVLGTVAGSELGKGAFQLTSDIVDYVRRPAGLIGAADIYALYVEGESMLPKFEPGDLVFVHPHRKPRPRDYVVVQEPDTDNGGPRGFIKRLVTTTTRLVRTEQFNPKANIDFVIRPGLQIHKVMTDGELYGI
jgi:phage repressor protein C with HTH and peptisase S24 domain